MSISCSVADHLLVYSVRDMKECGGTDIEEKWILDHVALVTAHPLCAYPESSNKGEEEYMLEGWMQ